MQGGNSRNEERETVLIISLLLFPIIKLISQAGNFEPPVEYVKSENVCT